jgi:hypothetical protein
MDWLDSILEYVTLSLDAAFKIFVFLAAFVLAGFAVHIFIMVVWAICKTIWQFIVNR